MLHVLCSPSSSRMHSSAARQPWRRRGAALAAAAQPPEIDLDALLGGLEAPEIEADLAALQAEQVSACNPQQAASLAAGA